MRILVAFALLIIGAGGYFAYFNDTSVAVKLTASKSYNVGLAPLLLGAVTVGLAMGIGGTVLRDAQLFFIGLSRKRKKKHIDRIGQILAQAEGEWLAGRPAKARDLFRKVIKIDPEHVTAINRLGNLARDTGNYKEAVSLHRLAGRLEPEHPVFRLAVIDDYLAMESYENALQHLTRALQESPRDQALLGRMRDLHVATGDWKAAADAQEAFMTSPMHGLDSTDEMQKLNAFRYRAATALLEGGKTDQGKNALKELVKNTPTFAPAHMALGEQLLGEGRVPEALKVYKDGYDATRDESFLPPIENLFIVHLEEPREALRFFSALVERDPRSLRLRYWLGRIYFRLEMIDDALHIFTQLEQQVEQFPELFDMLGRINLRRGETGEALSAFGEGTPQVAYACTACGMPEPGWAPSCHGCHAWGTISPALSVTPRPGALEETTSVVPAQA